MFANLRERLKGWKTIIVNAITGLPATLLFFYTQFASVDFTPLIPAKYVALFVVLQSVLGIMLRLVTTGPVGSRGDEPAMPQTKAGD